MGVEPAAVTGMVSCSPLGAAEAETATGVRVITRESLCDPAQANALLAGLLDRQHSRPAALDVAEVGFAA